MKIARQEIVVAFEIDSSIVLSCGSAVQSLQKKTGGQIHTINAPHDAPPSMPRIILRLEDVIINLGFDRLQITAIPPSQVMEDVVKSSQFTLQRINPFLTELLPVIPKYRWTGIITDIEIHKDPTKNISGLHAVTPVFDRLVKIDRNGRNLSAFNLHFGTNDNHFFKSYAISGFDGRKVKLKSPPPPGVLSIDLDDYPITECGIRVLLDINNKPDKNNNGPEKDIDELISETNRSVHNLKSDLNLDGVI